MRQYIPLSTFILAWGEPALRALGHFMELHPNVAVFTFKPLQGLLDWQYMKPIIGVLAGPKVTVSHVSSAISKACRSMWLHWHVCHPGITNEVHPDRSMIPPYVSTVTNLLVLHRNPG